MRVLIGRLVWHVLDVNADLKYAVELMEMMWQGKKREGLSAQICVHLRLTEFEDLPTSRNSQSLNLTAPCRCLANAGVGLTQ
jgi:hypothetical protein